MISLLPKLREAFPFVGERSATEDDLFRFCFYRQVEVVFRDDIPTGVYAMSQGEHFIFLNTKLIGWTLRYVFTHEIGHYLFHAPSNSNFHLEFFTRESKHKNHIEAEQVAAMLLLPVPEIEDVLISGAYVGDPELAELLAVRLRILDAYKF
jgi:Zn-dependent peptidase ImmA (M78 family)